MLVISHLSCNTSTNSVANSSQSKSGVTIHVLGTAQDAGSPQISCDKDCCKDLWKNKGPRRMVSCLGVIDHKTGQSFVFDATPDFKFQWQDLKTIAGKSAKQASGIFLTHAHIGHYTGILDLGKEAMSAKSLPVYAMPRLAQFLSNNGPWSQLVAQDQIALKLLQADSAVLLSPKLSVRPVLVPHRDEFSETVGFVISGPNKKALFIPDIDKWSKWKHNIVEEVAKVDYAFLDATFYSGKELPGRNMSEIPHPSVQETMQLFANVSAQEKEKIHFIHFNHTNPLLNTSSKAIKEVTTKGFSIAKRGMTLDL
jgi:pyrroloquinoline quinone biosynthesis protein B